MVDFYAFHVGKIGKYTSRPMDPTPWKINGWNLQITHLERKMIFQPPMIMFHVNLPGCTMGCFFEKKMWNVSGFAINPSWRHLAAPPYESTSLRSQSPRTTGDECRTTNVRKAPPSEKGRLVRHTGIPVYIDIYIYVTHIHISYTHQTKTSKNTLPLQRCCCKKVFNQFLWLMFDLLFVCSNCLSQMFIRNSTASQPQIGPFMTSPKFKLRDQSLHPKKIMTQCFYIAQSLGLFFGVVYGRYGIAGQN